MTAADRPSVTDNARAEAERRYGTPRESDLLPSDYVTIGQIEGYVEGRLAAGRAETTTEEWPRCKASRDGGCDRCHDEHGRHIHCRAETTTATDEDATVERLRDAIERVPKVGPNAIYEAELLSILREARDALLATARTRPTREQIIDALVMSPLSDTAGTDLRPFEQTADAVLALLRGGDRDE